MKGRYPDTFLVTVGCEQGEARSKEILIIEWVLACIGSGVNRVTVLFGADTNNELSCRKQDNSVRLRLILCSSSGILTCCCFPYETYGRNGGLQFSDLFTELPVPPQAA